MKLTGSAPPGLHSFGDGAGKSSIEEEGYASREATMKIGVLGGIGGIYLLSAQRWCMGLPFFLSTHESRGLGMSLLYSFTAKPDLK